MDFIECLVLEQVHAVHLRRLADGQARSAIADQLSATGIAEVDDLARENRELRFYLTAVTQMLVEKGLIRITKASIAETG